MTSRPAKQTYLSIDQIRKRMADYCVYRDRSEREVRRKLAEFRLRPEVEDDIVAFLIQHQFLDDLRFARSYARGKFYHNRWGKRKIVEGLRRHGLTDYYIRQALDEIPAEDYAATLRRLIARKRQSLSGVSPAKRRTKIIAYLQSKGYDYAEFKNILDEICQTPE